VLTDESYLGRISSMGMTKLSVTVEEDLVDELRERAGDRGISAFVNQAVRHELQLARLGELLADLENELGPPDEAMVVEALASLDRLQKQQSRTKRQAARR
jgi:Arc/MetJ family transcription regulator